MLTPAKSSTSPAPDGLVPGRGKLRSVALLLACQVLAMCVWFSSAAVLPQIKSSMELSGFRTAALTSAVQVGFVLGTLVSAILRLPDRVDPRRVFALSALAAGVCTAALVLIAPAGDLALLLRLMTGISLAGVYPIGMRIAATWASGDLGWLVGLLVAALTLGSATPHLVAAVGLPDWRWIYLVVAAAACVSAGLITRTELGPAHPARGKLSIAAVSQAWRVRPLLLANLGYLGHMWELYAMWAWLGLFLTASFKAADVANPLTLASIATFAVIASGAIGAAIGGLCADRVGRTITTIVAMAASACCALTMGWLYGGPPAVIVVVGLVWGITVIADSAQFSASIVELSDASTVGTMLTLQTSAGFLLTLVSIQLTGPVVDALGWAGGFSMLAVGPALGCWAMASLRRHPAARALAGGRR